MSDSLLGKAGEKGKNFSIYIFLYGEIFEDKMRFLKICILYSYDFRKGRVSFYCFYIL